MNALKGKKNDQNVKNIFAQMCDIYHCLKLGHILATFEK